jgi:hypothetical protein
MHTFYPCTRIRKTVAIIPELQVERREVVLQKPPQTANYTTYIPTDVYVDNPRNYDNHKDEQEEEAAETRNKSRRRSKNQQ